MIGFMKNKNYIQRKNRIIGNKGFSLVELIVVIAIMAAFVGITSLSYQALTGKQAKQCRDELVSKLESVRALTMGTENVVANLKKDSTTDSYVMTVTSTVNGSSTDTVIHFPSSKCEMYYSLVEDDVFGSEDNSFVLLDGAGTTGIDLEFDRASGALKKQVVGSLETCVYHIYVKQGNKAYGLRIYQETGKIVLE